MCIAILNTKTPLKKEYLNNSWENNDQGAGLLYNENGKLKTFKTYNKKEFINEYYRVRKLISGKIVLHFRIATSGHKKYVNLHPFLVNENLGFVHNGIISNLGNNDYSDTYQFNQMLQNFKHDFLNCPTSIQLIKSFISSSKLLFLDSSDNHHIINENKGTWEDDNWFSNDSYRLVNDYSWYGNTKVSKGNKTTYLDSFCTTESSSIFDDEYLTDKEFAERLSYYTNVTNASIDYLADLLQLEKNSRTFVNDIEEYSYICNSLDIDCIIDYILTEYYDFISYGQNYNK